MTFSLTLSTGTISIKSNDRKLSTRRHSCEQRILTLYKENNLYLPVRLYTLTDDDLLILSQGIIDHLRQKRQRESKISKIEEVLDSFDLKPTTATTSTSVLDRSNQEHQTSQSEQLTTTPQQPDIPNTPSSDTSYQPFSSYGKREVIFSRPQGRNESRPLKLDFNKLTDIDPILTPFQHIGHVIVPANCQIYVLDEENEAGIGSLTSSATFGEYGSKANYINNTTVTSCVPALEDPDKYPYGYCYVHLAHPLYRPQYNNANLFLNREILDKLIREPLYDGLLYLHLFKNRLHISHQPVHPDTISCPIKAATFIKHVDPLIKQGQYPSFNDLFDLFKKIHNDLMKNTVQVYRSIDM